MSLIFALLTLSFVGATNEGISRQQLIQLIDAAQEANFRDVSFDYEGMLSIPNQGGRDEVTVSYTGSFSRRADRASLVDLYTFDHPAGKGYHSLVAILGETTEYSSQRADEKNSSITIEKQGPLEFAGTGNYRKVWLSDHVRKLAESAYQYSYEGVERIEGKECVVVRFRLVLDDSTPKDKTVSYLFWVDLRRGGHVVRHEQRYWGENLASLTTVRLGHFDLGKGRMAWLPISGRDETRMTSKDNKPVFLGEAVSYETFHLLPVTLRFDQELKDDVFSVKAQVGDAISDEVRKARYEFGQYMVRPQAVYKRTTDAEIKANLDRMLKDSAVMAGELKASSPLRDGPGFLSYWPWGVAGLAFLGAGFLFYKSRNP